jgi:tripartite-type tricarboxylate transporter receptor subunit TctC
MLRLGAAVVLAVVAAAMPAATQAQAQTPAQAWPQRPVRFILPLGPGAGVDITARLLGDRLAAKWGQSVVIENRPGGDGVVAVTAFTGAQDDHTVSGVLPPSCGGRHSAEDANRVDRIGSHIWSTI